MSHNYKKMIFQQTINWLTDLISHNLLCKFVYWLCYLIKASHAQGCVLRFWIGGLFVGIGALFEQQSVVCWVPIVGLLSFEPSDWLLRIFWSIVGGNRKYLRTRLGCGRKPSERARVPSEGGRNYVNEGWCHEARRRDTWVVIILKEEANLYV